jgi:hypothetical protein
VLLSYRPCIPAPGSRWATRPSWGEHSNRDLCCFAGLPPDLGPTLLRRLRSRGSSRRRQYALHDATKGDCRKAFLAAKAKENLTESSTTESNNRKVTSMVENIISGLYLVGDVALLGLLVYNSHKPHHKIKRGWNHIYESEPIKGLRQQLHGLQGPQGKR